MYIPLYTYNKYNNILNNICICTFISLNAQLLYLIPTIL